jgi:two-component system LytT family sensor kinase
MKEIKSKKFVKNRFTLIVFLFLALDIGYYFLLKSFSISATQIAFEVVVSFVLILFFSFILQRIHSFYHSRSAISIVHLSIVVMFSFLVTVFMQEYGSWIGKNDPIYDVFLAHSFYLRWFSIFLIFLAIVNQLWIDKHIREQQKSVERLVEKERQLVKAEMSNLQQQFQPHFLFNSLNSISALVKIQPDNARTMIHNLSDFLRLTLQKSKEEETSLKEEIEYLNLYLAIEKVRFGHRLTVDIQMDEASEVCLLPALILQPIVENAIKFGLYGNTGDLTITINAAFTAPFLKISVVNPYDSVTSSTFKGTGYGLASVDRKLQLLFKRTDLLKIEQTTNYYTVTLLIPQA